MFWALAKRLGRMIDYAGLGVLDMQHPTVDDLLTIKLKGAPVTLDQVKEHPHGKDHAGNLGLVSEPPPDAGATFDVMPDDVRADLMSFWKSKDEIGQKTRDGQSYEFLMSTRRLRDVFNSSGTQLASVRRRTPQNSVHLNGADLIRLGVKPGDLVELSTSHGRAIMVAARDDQLRFNVASTTHCWGDLPNANINPREVGTCVNLLIDSDRHFEAINAMPHFSAVPVNIRPYYPRPYSNDEAVKSVR